MCREPFSCEKGCILSSPIGGQNVLRDSQLQARLYFEQPHWDNECVVCHSVGCVCVHFIAGVKWCLYAVYCGRWMVFVSVSLRKFGCARVHCIAEIGLCLCPLYYWSCRVSVPILLRDFGCVCVTFTACTVSLRMSACSCSVFVHAFVLVCFSVQGLRSPGAGCRWLMFQHSFLRFAVMAPGWLGRAYIVSPSRSVVVVLLLVVLCFGFFCD